MQHIETVELGSTQATITFSNIPQDFDDLYLITSTRSDRSADVAVLAIKINSSTSNFTSKKMTTNGSSIQNSSRTDSFIGLNPAANADANTFGNRRMFISNYAQTQANPISTMGVYTRKVSQTGSDVDLVNLLWNDTNAITSVEFYITSGDNFVANSVVSLYGITNA